MANDITKATNIPSNLLNLYYGDVVIKGPGKTYKYSGDVFNILALFLSNRDNIYFTREIERQMAIALANYIKNTNITSSFISELRQILKQKQSGRRPRTKKRDKYNLYNITNSMYFEAEPNPKRRQTGITVGRVYYALKYRLGSKGSLFHLYDQGWLPRPGVNKRMEPFAFFIGNKYLINKFETLFDNIMEKKPEIFKDVLSSINFNVIVKEMAGDKVLRDEVEAMSSRIVAVKDIETTMKRYMLKKFIDTQFALQMLELKTNLTSETIASILAESYGEMKANVIVNSIFSDDINIKKSGYDSKGDTITKNLNISGISSAKYLMESYFTKLSTSDMNRIYLDYSRQLSAATGNIYNMQSASRDVVREYNYIWNLNKDLNFIEGAQLNNLMKHAESALSFYTTSNDLKSEHNTGYRINEDVFSDYIHYLAGKNNKVDIDILLEDYKYHIKTNLNRTHKTSIGNLKEIKELNEDVIEATAVKDREIMDIIRDSNDLMAYEVKEQIKVFMIQSQMQKEEEEEEAAREAEAAAIKEAEEAKKFLDELTEEDLLETLGDINYTNANDTEDTPTIQINTDGIPDLNKSIDSLEDINIIQDI